MFAAQIGDLLGGRIEVANAVFPVESDDRLVSSLDNSRQPLEPVRPPLLGTALGKSHLNGRFQLPLFVRLEQIAKGSRFARAIEGFRVRIGRQVNHGNGTTMMD